MSRRNIWTCDRCKTEAEGGLIPPGWTHGDIRFDALPKMGQNQLPVGLDLCEPCQDELKRVWDEWLKPPKKLGWPWVREPHQESQDRQARQASVMPTPDSVMDASWPKGSMTHRHDNSFKAGEAVVCVVGDGGLTEGERYTVAKVHPVMMGSVPLVELADLRGAKFHSTRFRHVDEESAA